MQNSPNTNYVTQALGQSSDKSISKKDEDISRLMHVLDTRDKQRRRERIKEQQDKENIAARDAARDAVNFQKWEQERQKRERREQRERRERQSHVVEYRDCAHQQNFRVRDDFLESTDTQPPESRLVLYSPKPSYHESCSSGVGSSGPRNAIQVVGATNRNSGWRTYSHISPSPYRYLSETDHR